MKNPKFAAALLVAGLALPLTGCAAESLPESTQTQEATPSPLPSVTPTPTTTPSPTPSVEQPPAPPIPTHTPAPAPAPIPKPRSQPAPPTAPDPLDQAFVQYVHQYDPKTLDIPNDVLTQAGRSNCASLNSGLSFNEIVGIWMDSGLPDYTIATLLVGSVSVYCPEHVPAMDDWVANSSEF
jgi:hypothetical protein